MKKRLLLPLVIGLLVFTPAMVLALDFSQPVSQQDQATFSQILQPVMTIYNLVKYAASALAGVALLVSGIAYMASGNDPKKRDNAKGTATYVVVGLLVIWAAPLIVQLIVGQ